jgi:hypothetical protein
MNLYKISLSLNKLGLNWKTKEYSSYETDKTIRYKAFINGDYKEKSIHKNTLMKMSDRIIPSTTFIANSIYCYEEDIEKAKQQLYNHVILNVNKFKTEVDQLYIHILNDIVNLDAKIINQISKTIIDERASNIN